MRAYLAEKLQGHSPYARGSSHDHPDDHRHGGALPVRAGVIP